METVYTLKENKNTNEYHLFKATMNLDNKCTPSLNSICKEMSKDNSKGNKFACLNEKDARLECAKIGRKVCGTCVSNLYGN